MTDLANTSCAHRIFLLSPANAAGKRAQLLLRQGATLPMAEILRQGGLPLGEVFSFISGLYFRGKLAYANAFAAPPRGTVGSLIITACAGLLPPTTQVTHAELCQISAVPIDAAEPRYRIPLERDARLLHDRIGDDCQVVLLGSIATPKYIDPLLAIFGQRLVFPREFAGRGDMARGSLMLRCARDSQELAYVPALTAARHNRKAATTPRPKPSTLDCLKQSHPHEGESVAKA